MHLLPDAEVLPSTEAPPAGDTATEAELLRQAAPRHAVPQHVQDATQRRAVGHPRRTTVPMHRFGRQQRRNCFPELITD